MLVEVFQINETHEVADRYDIIDGGRWTLCQLDRKTNCYERKEN